MGYTPHGQVLGSAPREGTSRIRESVITPPWQTIAEKGTACTHGLTARFFRRSTGRAAGKRQIFYLGGCLTLLEKILTHSASGIHTQGVPSSRYSTSLGNSARNISAASLPSLPQSEVRRRSLQSRSHPLFPETKATSAASRTNAGGLAVIKVA